ncbi:MAG TPA: response regulator [Clostridiales bacterium]|nr:response regulator [Clostridiales bacterium]
MIKLFLVDDEVSDRDLIVRGINWDDIFIELVGYAANGEDAIQLIRNTRPNIVLTDISMPVKNGIHLANLLKEEFPDIKVIFISGYQEFCYAKAAIEYNVVHYIVKPVNIFSLSNLLSDVAKQCIEENKKKFEMEIFKLQLEQSLPLLKESFFREWIFGSFKDEDILKRKLDFLNIPFIVPNKSEKNVETIVIVLQLDDFKDKYDYSEYEKQLLNARVLDCINDAIERYGISYCFSSKFGEYVIIIQNQSGCDSNFNEEVISKTCDIMRRNIELSCMQTCTIGIGGFFYNLVSVPDYYKKCIDAIQYKFYYGANQIFFYNDVKLIGISGFDSENYKLEIIKFLKIGDGRSISNLLDEILGITSYSQYFNIHYIKNLSIEILSACLNTINEYPTIAESDLKDITDIVAKLEKFGSIDSIWNWLKKIILEMSFKIYSNVKNKNAIIVKHIKEIISAKYDSIVSVEQIAEDINLSPGYASTVFKNETGETIIQYLTYVRMQNAIKLLEDTNLMVFEIAQRIGYNNTTHFASVFKNNIGISPGEYRKK